MAYAAVLSLQKTIENLLNSPRISLAPPSPQIIESAYQQLKSLQEILKKLDGSSKSNSRKNVNALDARIKEAVWKFEDLVESHVYDQILPQSEIIEVNLQELKHDADSFTKLLKEKEEEYMNELDNPSPEEEEEEEEAAVPSTTHDSGAKKFKMVGSSHLLRKIRDDLKDRVTPYRRNVVSVSGMAGVGKTTLVKEIFDDPLIFNELEFERRAWVTVGRKYQVGKLKRDILVQLDPDMDLKLIEGGEKDEEHYLKEFFEAKRCLIVLDDVWDTDVRDHLKNCLMAYVSGKSRLLLTTRLKHLARFADPLWHALRTYEVELLNEDESWDLLRQMVFGEDDSCPREFIKAGKKIAEKCDGLPLMIVAVADLLSKAEMKAEYWEEVARSKNSEIFMAAHDQLYEVLLPSYEYLPQHLKPCFLHLGVFPQNFKISSSKLESMWIGEGFLELLPIIEDTLEECIRRYLAELISHNVVIRCQTSINYFYRSNAGAKKCRLQSSFWHLCNREARNGKFFGVLSSYADGFDQDIMSSQRRLSIHNNMLFAMNDVCESVEYACASTARSLLFYGPYYPYQVPICLNLRLLKLLDALQIRFYEFPLQVLQLVYLMYLSLTYNGDLPASISKFWNLQFLIIHRNMIIKRSGVTPYMPIEIWDMKQLKHIQIMGSNLPNPASGASLESLSKLIGVGAETCTKEVFGRTPNLSKLGIQIELHPHDGKRAFHCLDHIRVLGGLTSLKCVVVNPVLSSEGASCIPAPPESIWLRNLRKLHLSGLGYPWEYMSIIGSLPNLQVLKLRHYAFTGPKWEVKHDTFCNLVNLQIDGTDLVHFQVGVGGFLYLLRLSLKHCYKLQHIQWENNRSFPSEVEVVDCSPSTMTFANEMRSKSKILNVHSSWDDVNIK